MNFASDNTAPVAPAILDALVEANRGFALGYGNDNWTHAIERRFCEIFEREVAALAEIARMRSLAVHMDGARFANALVRLNATPAEITWRSGIDVLSFGATKGGALAAEAVIFFDPEVAAFFGERRKRGGHLL